MDLLRAITFILMFGSTHAWSLELSPLHKAPYLGDLDDLKEKQVLRVLVAADLGFYYIKDGEPKGIIAELLQHFENHLKKNKQPLKIQIIPVERDQLLGALEAGFGDMSVANLTITPQRLKSVDFSQPVIKNIMEYVVTHINRSEIKTLADFSGKEVWVRPSSSYFESLQNLNKTLSEQGLAPIQVNFIEETLQDYELLEMVNRQIIPATVIDSHKADFWLKVMPDLLVHRGAPIRSGGEIAWSLRKNSPQLKQLVNDYIHTIKQGTLLGNIIYKKYLKNTSWLKTAISPEKVDRFEQLSPVFNQYANKYQFDWLMISAQAFQESRFDNSSISSKGAVGIMQVLPTTAKEPYVNIPNIYKLENNVHAGVRYLRFILDRYFTDEEISIDNRMYFALAAYNAGPAKIRKMRRLAKEYGYDDKIWFNNVEMMARKYISREPVNYVNNISRYYVIYKQISQLHQMRKERNAKNLTTNHDIFPE
ncbi:lytic transglycosylase F [Vibrio sp. Of7-15]|uniref:transglycosylase SLT domain-containing protein n=1 Tax=Vibrio sp. Of7-15 TaxID=2724879 RepID=UPI001EF1BEB2|nr:lytic transglycosylase F [Vibrio sp. Of7-15]MCG7495295.1 lytic transglycosylase F [Vibrio sp. Of7-15]